MLFPNTLQATRDTILGGADIPGVCQQAIDTLLSGGFDAVDYLEVREIETLTLANDLSHPARLFGAVRLGDTRLIDNWPVE